jgi:N6-adenosine-specific RNA methylase IME4
VSAAVKVAKDEMLRQTKIAEVEALREQYPEGRIARLEDAGERFRCIYVDPPWRYGDEGCGGGLSSEYSTMTLEAICALPVAAIAEPDSHLWLWTTWPMMRDGAPQRVLEAWGFRWVGEIIWVKDGLGVGRWLRPSTEILILGVKGKLKLLRYNQRGHLSAEREGHSVKPAAFYEIIETLTPGPRLEMFARRARNGWKRWGDQA